MKSLLLLLPTTTAFILPTTTPIITSTSALQMGLFDGVKEAFGADGMGELDADRETPIDRWMGWNAKRTDGTQNIVGSKAPQDFIDSMDPKNYIQTSLSKPMGIVFEENDKQYGGIFVLEINPDSNASKNGQIQPGDQLVGVDGVKVAGLEFEQALGKIIESQQDAVKLVLFRGPAKFLYGTTGASREWLDEFLGEKSVV